VFKAKGFLTGLLGFNGGEKKCVRIFG